MAVILLVTEKDYIYTGKYFGAVALYGISGNSKPTTYGNGSLFVEVDTGKIYQFDAENLTWYEIENALKAKVDELEEKVNALTHVFVNDIITESPQKIGELETGDWVCALVYPLNPDITIATNEDNEVIVTSSNYTGAVVALCFKV